MERKRQAEQRSTAIVQAKRRKTEAPATLVLKTQKVPLADCVRDSVLSPLELLLSQFEDKENDSSMLAKLIRVKKLLADASHCELKLLGGFVHSMQKLTSQYQHNEDILCVQVRICKHVVKQAPGAIQGMKELLLAFLKQGQSCALLALVVLTWHASAVMAAHTQTGK